MSTPKMTFQVEARRVDAHRSLARCKDAEIALDTDQAGNPDAFNPAELLLAALSACMIKGIERGTPLLHFSLRGVEVKVDGARQDVKTFGTVFKTVAPGTALSGVLRRKDTAQ
jgi:uncharacterized OsmC-like protein